MAPMSVFRFSAVALLLLSACCWADNEVDLSERGAVRYLVLRPHSHMLLKHVARLLTGDVQHAVSHMKPLFFSTLTKQLPSRSSDRDWLSIASQNGCYFFVGRREGKQVVSLARRGCLYHGTVQHELLHALGMEHNFRKIATLNQGTPYDYGSVMQYHKYAFSKNNQPTMVPIPNSNVNFGNAKEMSRTDIARLNTLYGCCECPHKHTDTIHVPHAACLYFVSITHCLT
uniref:Metalloendopeptidase n=1 Tax=Cyclopterus lumpus TaxID=8103 RepID=A0A8C2WDT8_CYCLU